MFTSNGKLEIFENFQKLPKTKETITYVNNIVFTTSTANFSTDGINIKYPNIFQKAYKKVTNFLFPPNPNKIFKEIKNNLGCLANNNFKKYENQSQYMVNLLTSLENTGQTALYEKLKNERFRMNLEMSLFMIGINFYADEDNIKKFIKLDKSGKDLKLTWLKNYVQIIPPNIMETINIIKTKDLFENFVVMHYDPSSKNVEETQKEKELRKDPILFGVVSYSNRLYFIDDWIDDYCDLTLTKFVDTVGINMENNTLIAKNIAKPLLKEEPKEKENNI